MFPVIIEVPVGEGKSEIINLNHMTRMRVNPENDQTTALHLVDEPAAVVVTVPYAQLKGAFVQMQQAMQGQRSNIVLPPNGQF